jgi:hypothetical protein
VFVLLRLIINAVALLVTAWIVPGIHLGAASPHPTKHDWVTLLIVALIFGVVNALIRPIIILLSLPLDHYLGPVHIRHQRVHAASDQLDCPRHGPWVTCGWIPARRFSVRLSSRSSALF